MKVPRRGWKLVRSVRFLKGGQASIPLAVLEAILGPWDAAEWQCQLQVLIDRGRKRLYLVPTLKHPAATAAPGCVCCFVPLLPRARVLRFRADRILEALQLTPPMSFHLHMERKMRRLRVELNQPQAWNGGNDVVL